MLFSISIKVGQRLLKANSEADSASVINLPGQSTEAFYYQESITIR